ncbi:MAG: tRNA uridine-5-carboxymethylaminomethyl(34) synthesis GTPase MnmE [Chlamydiales bacterium]|nr:tRNA uridine-5-carboxymethylaminomethyl(34) synthesis GTPase MnmE [Chlamydiales bacterium]
MEFVHRTYQVGDTIAAIATPPGEGGIAIIRITGKSAITIAEKVFSGPVKTYKTHTAHYGKILNNKKEVVDHVLLLVMLGGNSYAGEDTVEIHCHGGSIVSRRVLEVVFEAGARSAYPGEFTFKAFMNGKIDLVQAEAVQELIAAKNERALDFAQGQLEGSLSKKITFFQDELITIASILEAWVDFPEEGLEFSSMEELCLQLEGIIASIQKLVDTFHDGKILHEGVTLCLAGAPNVGKSSLMNMLLDKDRAIVTSIPGTTRDILEDHFRLNGLNVRLMDTAGIRDAEEIIEQEGIRRSRLAMSKADLILFVLDASCVISASDQELLDDVPMEKTIVIWNKVDLPHAAIQDLPFKHTVKVSAKEKWGLEQLKEKIDQVIWEKGPPSKDELIITNLRHKEALLTAMDACYRVVLGLRSGVSPEFLTFDMRSVLTELGTIIGTNITEDILSSIFSKFCIGK